MHACNDIVGIKESQQFSQFFSYCQWGKVVHHVECTFMNALRIVSQ